MESFYRLFSNDQNGNKIEFVKYYCCDGIIIINYSTV